MATPATHPLPNSPRVGARQWRNLRIGQPGECSRSSNVYEVHSYTSASTYRYGLTISTSPAPAVTPWLVT
jgi:hypothetical protein